MICDDIHIYILKSVRQDIDLDSNNDKILLRYLFKNYRHYKDKNIGLRLTFVGNQTLRKHFQDYSYPMEGKINNRALIALDKSMLWPYYIGKQYVSFYSKDDAAWFQLNGNNLNNFSQYI